jgi:hypothetical protein
MMMSWCLLLFCFILFLCTPKKMTMNQCSLSFCFVLFLCTQKRWWWVNAHGHFVLFCFCARKEDNDKLALIVCLVLFCFCAPKEDDNELMLIAIFFCFVFVHLEKMMTIRCWSLFFLFFFYAPKVSQPHFEGSVRSPLTLPKMGLESPLGLLKTWSSITGVKTPRLEVFFMPLERSWSVDVENGFAWAIRTFAAQVMCKKRVGSQTGSLIPEHEKSGIDPTSVRAGIWMWSPWSGAEYNIWGKVVASPEFGPWWVKWVQSCPWLVLAPRVLQNVN